jgi:hypothetical protein
MPHVQPFLVAQLLALLILVNGTPVIATKILGTVLARPLDGGMTLQMGSLYLATPKPFAASCSRLS